MEATNTEQDSNAEENKALPPGIEITTYPKTGNIPDVYLTGAKHISADGTKNLENTYIPLELVVEYLIKAKTDAGAGKIASLLKAAEQGDAVAQNNLGVRYHDGEDIPQDHAQAAHLFAKAAEQGYARAQKNLGLCYYYGEGVPNNYAKAAHWFEKAAEQGEDTILENAKMHLAAEKNGYIELAIPIAHINFKEQYDTIGDLLGVSADDLEKVIYYERYIVTDAGNSQFKNNQVISEDEYEDIKDKANFIADRGAIAMRKVLIEANLPDKPEEIILDILPIIHPDLRPAGSNLHEFYRKVVNLNCRLKRLIDARAPDIILRKEKRALQEAVYNLLENIHRCRNAGYFDFS